MTTHIRNTQWLDQNGERSYPLAIDATSQDITGSFELPDDFLVAMRLAVHAGLAVDPAKFYIKSLINDPSGFGITIGYDDGSADGVNVATCNISRSAYSKYQRFGLVGIGDFIDANGWLQLGVLDSIDLQPPGQFAFTLAGSRLETDVVQPMIRGISGVRVQNGSTLSPLITGDLIIQAGRNQRITPIIVEGEDTVLVFDSISGEGLNADCVCDDDVENAPAIRMINGVGPTSDGRFTFLGDDCIEFTGIENGLQVRDLCSNPCCGCTELVTVTAQMQTNQRVIITLENYIQRLGVQVDSFHTNVLGSRLGDRGCGDPSTAVQY